MFNVLDLEDVSLDIHMCALRQSLPRPARVITGPMFDLAGHGRASSGSKPRVCKQMPVSKQHVRVHHGGVYSMKYGLLAVEYDT